MAYDKEYPEPEKNACGGLYCSEEHGHIDCQSSKIHISKHPGLTMSGANLSEELNCDGSKYWKATAKIGSIFGSDVEGEIMGIGKTQELALEHLESERKKLYESLWY